MAQFFDGANFFLKMWRGGAKIKWRGGDAMAWKCGGAKKVTHVAVARTKKSGARPALQAAANLILKKYFILHYI